MWRDRGVAFHPCWRPKDPAAATADEGFELIERLADMLVTVSLETWPELTAD